MLWSLTWETLARKNIKKQKRLVFRLKVLFLIKNIFCSYFSPRWNFSLVARCSLLSARFSLLFACCSLLSLRCSLLVARLLVVRHFLVGALYFLLVAQQEILKDFFWVKVNRRFSISICTKILIVNNVKTRIVLNWRHSAIFWVLKTKLPESFYLELIKLINF